MRLTRRRVLGTMATATVLAGCTQGDGTQTTGDDRETSAAPADDPTSTAVGTDTVPATDESTTSEVQTTTTSATVRVAAHPELGDILVGSDGRTLYMFDPDTQGDGTSTCSGGCAEAWPPLTVEASPTAGAAVTAELDTFERTDGTTQITANGWPLYYFANDEVAGDANGQGVNDVWWVLRPDGTPVRTATTTATPTPTTTETATQTPTATTTEPDDGGDGGGDGPY